MACATDLAAGRPRGHAASVPLHDQRSIARPGSFNLRDLGGLPTADGAAVRRGQVFRSDYPGFVTADGGRWLGETGLATVVDLRRGSEAALECVDWAAYDVAYLRRPLVAGSTDSWHARYRAYLDCRPDSVVAAVRDVMAGANHPVLFHCAAGKDRTGTLAALLLDVLRVPRDAIIADYVASAASVAPVLARLMRIELYAAMLADSSVELQTPRADDMAAFLDWLATRGGAQGWLTTHGLPPTELDAFRRRMVKPL